jgi:hypothetical protein
VQDSDPDEVPVHVKLAAVNITAPVLTDGSAVWIAAVDVPRRSGRIQDKPRVKFDRGSHGIVLNVEPEKSKDVPETPSVAVNSDEQVQVENTTEISEDVRDTAPKQNEDSTGLVDIVKSVLQVDFPNVRRGCYGGDLFFQQIPLKQNCRMGLQNGLAPHVGV